MPKSISISICVSPHAKKHVQSCHLVGSEAVWEAFETEINALQLQDRVTLLEGPCQGYCQLPVAIRVNPGNVLYAQVTPADVAELLESHVVKGEVLKRLAVPRMRFFPGF